jgi:nitrogen regulatory protein PII
MKLVRAIVRSDKVGDITTAFDAANVDGVTVAGAAGRGGTHKVGIYRGRPYAVFEPMSIVEVIASDEVTEEIVKILLQHAHTGHRGDGHVLVISVDERYSIRTRWCSVA